MIAIAGCVVGLVSAAVALLVPDTGVRLLVRRLGDRFGDRRRSGSSVADGGRPAAAGRIHRIGWSLAGSCRRAISRIRPGRETGQDAVAREVRDACVVLATELRAGRTLERALGTAAASAAGLRDVARVARSGGDVSRAFGILAAACPAYRPIAGACSVGMRAGAGLADLVDRVGEGLAEEETIRREVAAQLAAPRATARLLAALPLLGLALGGGFGAAPARFLVSTPYGLGCLAAGGALSVLGLTWVDRLARRAGRLE